MELFTHPWYMAAGGLLVSSPILIHLINRMRFKRVRWAAMEFLLKSQKRNRRRLIIEQMILLLLRILLVLLAAFLVARFLYGGAASRGSTHLIVIDDSLSMGDGDREGGVDRTAFVTGIEEIKRLVDVAKEAPGQTVMVYRLSDLAAGGKEVWRGQLTDGSKQDIDTAFLLGQQAGTGDPSSGRKATLMHYTPLTALKKGREMLRDLQGDSKKIFHLVSDFRSSDWDGGEREKILEEVKGTLEDGVNVNFIDTAAPFRAKSGRSGVVYHGNLAVTDLRAQTNLVVVGERSPDASAKVEFVATVTNHGEGQANSFLSVYVNGDKDLTNDVPLERLEPGKPYQHKFFLNLRPSAAGPTIGAGDKPEDRDRKRRQDREIFHIRVTLRKEDSGLNVDNVRDTIVEVRRKMPILLVDGNKPESRGDRSDLFHLTSFYAAAGIYELEERRLAELEKMDLELYPILALVNVSELPDGVIAKLKHYVQNGGSIIYFLGEEVKADHYNTKLFDAKIFPVKMREQPYDPLQAEYPDPDKRKEQRAKLRQTDSRPKALFPLPEHPAVSSPARVASIFRYLSLNVYWQALPRSQWDPELTATELLMVRPNDGRINQYRTRIQELVGLVYNTTRKLAGTEKEYEAYIKPLQEYKERIIPTALTSGVLYKVGEALDELLANPQAKAQRSPGTKELWTHPDLKDLEAQLRELKQSVLYGDPLVVSRKSGRGRVMAYLTTAGTSERRGASEDGVQWNNFGAGDPLVQQLYASLMRGLHEYLVTEGQVQARTIGEDVEFSVDATRYEKNVRWSFVGQPDVTLDDGKKEEEKPSEPLPMQEDKAAKRYTYAQPNWRRPGLYKVFLTPLGDPGGKPEVRAFAFNVDPSAESDLKRAERDRVEPTMPPPDGKRGRFAFRAPGEDISQFKEKQPDASELPWLYLFFIIILVVEQALAVHLSFHTRSDDSAAPGTVSGGAPAAAA